MSTFLLNHVGTNKEHTVIYDLQKDGVILLKDVPHTQGMDYAMEVAKPGDIYQERCDNKTYCNQPIEAVWKNHVEMEIFYRNMTRKQADAWLKQKGI